MNLLLLMIPVSLLLGFLFLCLFIWANRSGQFEDLVTPSYDILVDDKKMNTEKEG